MMRHLISTCGRMLAGLCCAAFIGWNGVRAQTISGDVEAPGGRSVSFGTTTIDGKQWQRLAFRPEIPLGKLAIALDVEMFINEQGGVSSKGWEFGNATEIANTLYRKIYYIRYGQPRDPVFVRVGALDDVTLGYGMIVSHYRNTINYPGVKNVGMQFEFNPLFGFNVQGLVNNFMDINNGGPLVGLRIAKPWGPFEVGGTLAYDFDQYGGMTESDGDGVPDAIDRFPKDAGRSRDTDRDGIADEVDRDADGDGRIDIDFGEKASLTPDQQREINRVMINAGQDTFVWDDVTRREKLFNKNAVGRDPFGMVGFDIAFKAIDRRNLRLIAYGQLGISVDDNDGHRAAGWGLAAPGAQLIAGPLTGKLEYRFLHGEFEPEYFNNLYDHTRAVADFDSGKVRTKDSSLVALSGQNLQGLFGDVTLRLGNYVRLNGQYQYLHGNQNQQRLVSIVALDKDLVKMIPKLSRVEAFYTKRNIGLYGDGFFERTVDTMYGYRVGFALGGGVEVLWSTRWVFQPLGADAKEVKSSRQLTLETVVRF